jgi:hypothetical protein
MNFVFGEMPISFSTVPQKNKSIRKGACFGAAALCPGLHRISKSSNRRVDSEALDSSISSMKPLISSAHASPHPNNNDL